MKTLFTIVLCLMTSVQMTCQRIDVQSLDSSIRKADSLITNDPRPFFKNVTSLIVSHMGETLLERYYNTFTASTLNHLQSQTKSIVALLMGIAIDNGFVGSADDLAQKWFPEYFGDNDVLKSMVSIHDLLTMSAGFDWEEMIPFDDPANNNAEMYRSGKWLEYALSRSVKVEPGNSFVYCSGYPMIIAGIIEKATGMSLDEFAGKYLFTPLGINTVRWIKDSLGFCHSGGGLYMKPADMIKIGLLIMNNGLWGERIIVSEGWIKKMLTSYLQTSYDISTYGYYWWIREMRTGSGATTSVYSAEGAGGQMLFIIPRYGITLSVTEQNYTTPQVGMILLRESILPLLK